MTGELLIALVMFPAAGIVLAAVVLHDAGDRLDTAIDRVLTDHTPH